MIKNLFRWVPKQSVKLRLLFPPPYTHRSLRASRQPSWVGCRMRVIRITGRLMPRCYNNSCNFNSSNNNNKQRSTHRQRCRWLQCKFNSSSLASASHLLPFQPCFHSCRRNSQLKNSCNNISSVTPRQHHCLNNRSLQCQSWFHRKPTGYHRLVPPPSSTGCLTSFRWIAMGRKCGFRSSPIRWHHTQCPRWCRYPRQRLFRMFCRPRCRLSSWPHWIFSNHHSCRSRPTRKSYNIIFSFKANGKCKSYASISLNILLQLRCYCQTREESTNVFTQNLW